MCLRRGSFCSTTESTFRLILLLIIWYNRKLYTDCLFLAYFSKTLRFSVHADGLKVLANNFECVGEDQPHLTEVITFLRKIRQVEEESSPSRMFALLKQIMPEPKPQSWKGAMDPIKLLAQPLA